MRDFDKTILVTGCCGFIGSHLVKLLVDKYPNYMIIGLDSLTYCGNLSNINEVLNERNFIFAEIDIRNALSIKRLFPLYNITDVIHLAAESHVDNSIKNPNIFVETNVLGTTNLLNVAKEYWKDDYTKHRFHHVSTDEVYGALGMNDEPFNENTKYNPHSPYSASKAASDHFVKAYHDTYGMDVTISNCSNNYGTHQFQEKLIPKAIKNLCEGKKIPVYAKGENIRDWLYVEDHCAAIDTIFHNGKSGETYCVGGNNELTNIDLVNLIINLYCELTNTFYNEPPIEFVEDRKGHDLRYAIDSSKLQNELGWRPSNNWEEKIKETVKWFIEKFK